MRRLAVLLVAATMFGAVPSGAAECLTVAQAQARIDAAPDAVGPLDLYVKLRQGGHNYVEVNFENDCVTGPGVLAVDGRRGIWIKQLSAANITVTASGSEYTIFTGPDGANITIDGGSSRVEGMRNGALHVSDAYTLNGNIIIDHATFDAVEGFIRNFTVGTLTLTGHMNNFKVVGNNWQTLDNTATGDLRFLR